MDNIETTSPQGEAGATASSGETTQVDTQPTETTEAVSDGQVGEVGQASNPWDNDPKFKGKAPEDIYKAYTELQKVHGQVSRKAEIANLIEEKYGVSPDQLKAQIEAQELAQKREVYANNPLAPVLDKVSALEYKLQQQEQEKALQLQEKELDNFLKDNSDYAPHRDKILKLALTPGIGFNPDTGEETSFADLAREWVGEVRAQGQQDAYKKIDTKIMTQATGVSKGSPTRKMSPEDMKNLSSAEMESFLPHA
jgi:hypothetical protein